MLLSIAGHIVFSLDKVKEHLPELLKKQMALNFFKPLFFVLLNFLLFHSLEKHDLVISLAIIDIGTILWFFSYSNVEDMTFPFGFTVYVFCSVILTPIFYFLFFLIADLHFKIQVSFDVFNQELFLFMIVSMMVRVFLNYNLIAKKVPDSIYHFFYFLGLEPLILILVNWLFYPIPNNDIHFFDYATYFGLAYFFPIISFVYLITSRYIKELYFIKN